MVKNVQIQQIPYDETCDLLIAGLGFAGSFVTEAVCRKFPNRKIICIDKNEELLGEKSSSMQECFKMHTGIHYVGDFPTAEKCLINSMKMANTFSDYILDIDNPAAPTRRGRHYLMSNSFVKEEEVRKLCEQLTEVYRRELVNYPKSRKVFGDPDQFITYLSQESYPYVSNSIPFDRADGKRENIHVILGIETPESQIDIQKFRKYFYYIFVHCHSHVELLFKHEVVNVSFSPDHLGYLVRVKYINISTGKEQIKVILTKCWFNCLWNNMEIFDQQLGHFAEDRRANRLKIIIKGVLPEALNKINTCIFFSGPHASITHIYGEQGQDEAILTFEPVTNVGYYKAGVEKHRIKDKKVRELISGHLSIDTEPGHSYAAAIIKGAASYIPELKNFKPTYVGLGFVKNFFIPHQNYLYDPCSLHNQRRQGGWENFDIGHISFAGMKMTYTFAIAQEVVCMAEKHLLLREIVRLIIEAVLLKLKSRINPYQLSLDKVQSPLRKSLKQYILGRLGVNVSRIYELNVAELQSQLIGLKKSSSFSSNLVFVERIVSDYAKFFARKNEHLRDFNIFITMIKNKQPTKLFKLEKIIAHNLKKIPNQIKSSL